MKTTAATLKQAARTSNIPHRDTRGNHAFQVATNTRKGAHGTEYLGATLEITGWRPISEAIEAARHIINVAGIGCGARLICNRDGNARITIGTALEPAIIIVNPFYAMPDGTSSVTRVEL
jgi:hypothetical protein